MRSIHLAGLALLAACHSAPSADKAAAALLQDAPATLQGTWLLLPEASQADTLVYRRNTYRFRYLPGGRPGFWLGPAGRFARYTPAPGGGLQAQEGTWNALGPGQLRIHLPDAEPVQPDYTLELLSSQQGILKLRAQQ